MPGSMMNNLDYHYYLCSQKYVAKGQSLEVYAVSVWGSRGFSRVRTRVTMEGRSTLTDVWG